MDTEEGHLLPSFGLAHSLKHRGHRICYLTIIDNEELVKEQGFEFRPILENIYCKGYKEKYRKLSPPPGVKSPDVSLQKEYNEHISQLMKGAYDSIIEELGANLIIISAFLNLDTLILHYKYNIIPVIFTPFLRMPESTPAKDCYDLLNDTPADAMFPIVEFVINQGYNIDSLEQLVRPMDMFYELIACPHDLEISRNDSRENLFYIGPSMRNGIATEDVYTQYNIQDGKKIIYASMGSQPVRHGDICDVFFGKIINVMKCEELKDAHLILSVGPEYNLEKLTPLPGNITAERWVSQIDILKVASLAITHGGLGSVKECIYYGVPMIVFPLGYDQPQNARRVKFHNLGLTDEIETISEDSLKLYMLQAMQEGGIRDCVLRMQQVFRKKEEASLGADIIEKLLLKKEQDLL